MSSIYLGRGSIVVEHPDEEIKKELTVFRHEDGQYEELYTLNSVHNSLVTLPGFGQRIIDASDSPRIHDERMRMPEPDIDAMLNGVHTAWHRVLLDAVRAEGGVVSIPRIFGVAQVIAAILRAFPRSRLIDRGTPMSIVAAENADAARELAYAIRRYLPDRDVGIGHCDSDDIIVMSYKLLEEAPRHLAGVLILDMSLSEDMLGKAEYVSGFRNAARWAVCETAFGGKCPVDLPTEGLFGPLSASADYTEAVSHGVGVPVTVCWLPCPKPNAQLGSATLEHLAAIAMQENGAFVRTIADIFGRTSSDFGILLHVESVAMSKRVAKLVPGLLEVHRRTKRGERKTLLSDIASGTIRRAVVADDFIPDAIGHGVVIAATCRGADFVGRLFPWRECGQGVDKTYIVDFTHDWDVHNGRPGMLLRNDEARKRRYHAMGFSQMRVGDVSALPFV